MERLKIRKARISGLPGVSCTHFEGEDCQAVSGRCDEGCPWEDAVWERLAAYEDTGLTPGDIADWIYRPINPPGSEFEQMIKAVEKALGFKLFVWQKTYIQNGSFRQMGETTAKILKDLLDVSAEPIDYTVGAANQRQQFYKKELRKIKRKLDEAGIPTRTVFFSKYDKQEYLRSGRKGKP